LLNKKISFKELIPIILLHGFFLNILPSRTGEISYPYLLRKKGISLRESLSSLLIARIFDGIALASLFIISVFLLGRTIPPLIANIFTFISSFLVLAILFLMFIFYYGNKRGIGIKKIEKKFLDKTKLGSFNFVGWLFGKISNLVEGLQAINVREKVLELLLYSFGIWICGYFVYVILMEGMGIHLNIWAVFTGATFVVFASLLPIQGLAGFGTTEGMWALVFFTLGVEKELAIASGFSFHIIRIIFATTLGFISFIIIKISKRKKY
jgi:hypothetical protein